MKTMKRGLALGLVALVMLARPSEAAPIQTDLATIRAEATDIVIGTIGQNSNLDIDIDTVIRGTLKPGLWRMKDTPAEMPVAHGRVSAMIDAKNQFRWVGYLAAGPKLESGVLRLAGFFDFNAHLVEPGMLTFAQFEDYLATGKLTQHFEVTITAEDTKGGYAPTGESFQIDYDAFQGTSTITGFHGACLGNGSLHGLSWGSPEVTFSASCGHDRWLSLNGQPTGINAKGDITFEMSPRRPFLDVKDFPTYFKDPSYRDVQRILDVRLNDGTTWTWNASEAVLIDPQGKAHKGTTMSAGSRGNVVENGYSFGPDLEVTLVGGAPDGVSSDAAATFVRQIDTKTTGVCTFKRKGLPDVGCTLGRGVSKFVKR